MLDQANEHDVPFFYDFLLHPTVPEQEVPGVLKALDAKISSARRFLEYLNQISNTDAGKDIRIPDGYQKIQHELTAPIVDGGLFLTLNAEFNHAAFERADTAALKTKLEAELQQATRTAEEEKKKFNEALKNLEAKASKINGAEIALIDISKKGPDFLYHFERVCKWILDVYYDTPPSKYDWENFREQVFASDHGADLKNRIKGIYIPKLFDYQIETCTYVNSTRRLFENELSTKAWDDLLATSVDVAAAFDAREKYTKAKKLISTNKTKIIQATIDLTQGETIAKTSGPLIHAIMDEAVVRENSIRLLNLSDFQDRNDAQHSFHKDSTGQKINNFLREDALANYGKSDNKDSKGGKKDGKKDGKPGAEPKPEEPKPQPPKDNTPAPPPEKLEDIGIDLNLD